MSNSSGDITPSCLVNLNRMYQRSNLIEGNVITIRNTALSFKRISRDDTGIYNLSLKPNCVLEDDTKSMIESGSLTLNVICK